MNQHESFCYWLSGYLQACTDEGITCLAQRDVDTVLQKLSAVTDPPRIEIRRSSQLRHEDI